MVFKDIYCFLPNVQCYFTKHFYSEIYCIASASASINLYHVRLSYVIKGFTYLLTYLDPKIQTIMFNTAATLESNIADTGSSNL